MPLENPIPTIFKVRKLSFFYGQNKVYSFVFYAAYNVSGGFNRKKII